MRAVMLFMGGLARVFYRLIATPILLGWMIGAVLFGAMLGTIAGFLLTAPFFGVPPGQSAWEWVIYGPCILIGAIFGFQYWRMPSSSSMSSPLWVVWRPWSAPWG